MKRGVLTLGILALMMAAQFAGAAVLGPISVHGFASQGYMDSQDNNYIQGSESGTAAFREYGINATWQALEDLRIGAQVFGREYGSVGNDSIQLDWGLIDYKVYDWLGVRLGRMKVPYGFYADTRDIDALRTEILLPQGVYMEFQREILNANDGVGLYGDIDFESAGQLGYSIQYGKRALDEKNGDMVRILEGTGIELTGYEPQDSYAGQLEWRTPIDGLRIGATYSFMEYLATAMGNPLGIPGVEFIMSIDVDDQINTTASIEYMRGDLTLAAEYGTTEFKAVSTGSPTPQSIPILMQAAAQSGMPMDASQNAPVVQDDKYNGWYLKAAYRFTDWLEAAIGFSSLDGPTLQEGDTAASDKQEDIYLSARFDVTEYLIIKVEQHFIDGRLGVFDIENPNGTEESMSMLLAKASLIF